MGRGGEQGMRSEERRRKKGGERMKRCPREEKGAREREAGRGYPTSGSPSWRRGRRPGSTWATCGSRGFRVNLEGVERPYFPF